MPVTITCEVCGDEFSVPPSRSDSAKYCSSECYGETIQKESGKRDTYTCDCCGDEFEALKSRDRKFCSQECVRESQRNRVTLTCPVCGESFDVQEGQKDYRVCCSYSCAGKRQSRERVGENHPNYVESVVVECWACGEDIERKPSLINPYENHFCDHDCYAEYVSEVQSGENHYKWSPDSDSDYGDGWNEEKRETVRERDDYECQVCGIQQGEINEKLHVHHIRKARKFDDDEKRNATENLISLCRSCHKRAERISPLLPQ